LANQNHILKSLPPAEFELLGAQLQAVELPFRFNLEVAGRPIDYIYFPEDGLVSVVTHGGGTHRIEVGLIGFDGMSGSAVLLGARRSTNSLHMQVGGIGKRIAAAHLREAVEKSTTMRNTMLRYVQAFVMQASQTALANGRGKLETRLARWLLMAHDRLQNPSIPLTHEYLSVMLGVRRPGVTVALQKLEGLDCIVTARGIITIRNRIGLEKVATGIYGIAEAEQERLTGWRRLHSKRLDGDFFPKIA
jgi:CRP-like cAMP-binding protein